MIALALALTLGQAPAVLTADAPRIVHLTEGSGVVKEGDTLTPTTLPAGIFINEKGAEKLTEALSEMQINNSELTAQNELLRTRVDEIAADPPTNVKQIVIVAAISLVVGAAAGAGIVYAIKK